MRINLKKRRNESGDIAIEALFGLVIFIFAVMGVLMFSMLMQLEAKTQYAVDQVAKEISEYYYVAEKCGILVPPEEADVSDTDNAIEKGEKAISGLNSFAGSVADLGDAGSFDDFSGKLDDISANASSLQADANAFIDSVKGKDWGSQLTTILQLTLRSGASKVASQAIAGPICKIMSQKYLSVSDPDAYLKGMGIEDGLDGLNFGCSTFLADGYTINVALIYKVNLKKLTFGMLDEDVYVKQVGSTSAWIHYRSAMGEDEKKMSVWSIAGDFPRGKLIVSQMKEQDDYGRGISSRVGYDTYNADTDTFTEFVTIDLYHTRLTEKNEDGSYTLDAEALAKDVRTRYNKAYQDESKLKAGKEIKFSDSTEDTYTITGNEKHELVIVLPEEAKDDFKEEIRKIEEEQNAHSEENNLTVRFVYYEKGKDIEKIDATTLPES